MIEPASRGLRRVRRFPRASFEAARRRPAARIGGPGGLAASGAGCDVAQPGQGSWCPASSFGGDRGRDGDGRKVDG